MADILGTDGDDVLNGTNKADVIDGGAGDDIINSGAGNDIVSGGEGDDQIHAGAGDDELFGGEGNDQLVAGAGDDILEGGVGDDVLNGGGGSDTFVFNFNVSGGTGVTQTFLGFNAGSDGILQQGEYSSQYSNWLQSVGVDGVDANSDVNFAWNQNSSSDALTYLEGATADGSVSSVVVATGGPNTETRYYENSVVVGGGTPEITESDGNDTITQFQDAGPNVDKIVLNGLAGLDDTRLNALFDLTASDVNNDGVLDSVLSWQGGSITLLGTSTWGNDVLAFMHDDQVVLA